MQTYDQVANKNLQNLRLQALPSTEYLLENADQDVTKRSANEGAVDGHLGHPRGEIVSALAPVMGDPRCEELLETRKSTGCEHLGAEGVGLELR